MTLPLLFLLLVLTVHRITRLVTVDDFPLGRPRRWLELHHGESWLHRSITCPFCNSVWWSAGLVSVTDLWLVPLPYPLLWFGGVAGAVSILYSITTRLDD